MQTRLKWVSLALLLLSTSTGCSAVSNSFSNSSKAQSQPAPAAEPIPSVVAIGRLAPAGEVMKVSVPNAADSRVNQILVKEGDWVKAGQVIAVLQGSDRKQRDLEKAQKDVEYYRARLAQIQAGDAKNADIAAQQANIARLEAQLQNEVIGQDAAIASAEAVLRQAQTTYDRNVYLQQEGALKASDLDQARQELETAQATLKQRQAERQTTIATLTQQIRQERENLSKLREVRPVDVRVAQADLDRAMIAVEQSQADLEDTKVKAPIAGQVLRINTRVGEQVNTQDGVVELGRTDQMYAIAEVYETEIEKVKPGQKATVLSEYGGFAGKVQGVVEQVGLQVGKRKLSQDASDPTSDQDTRVVEVKIRIDRSDSAKIAALTNMQVRVEIHTGEAR
ncbi:HlyD family efflux transporter periplasmic adaptor subunit [Leptolyngbya ohadii]|uniref:HlyD family efflux transporter periplasmic adaptor subunit n=1 Tax=Leptolyngbya ohadii TaxID=1962290 RepID=UPI000B59E21F|nr:HlyD family efflux transporter periplasmic adaptor subunit [Leptolyngbya ohadii]